MTSLESVSYSKPLSRKSALPSLTHVPCDHTKARLNKVCGSGRWQRGNEDRLEAVAPRAAAARRTWRGVAPLRPRAVAAK